MHKVIIDGLEFNFETTGDLLNYLQREKAYWSEQLKWERIEGKISNIHGPFRQKFDNAVRAMLARYDLNGTSEADISTLMYRLKEECTDKRCMTRDCLRDRLAGELLAKDTLAGIAGFLIQVCDSNFHIGQFPNDTLTWLVPAIARYENAVAFEKVRVSQLRDALKDAENEFNKLKEELNFINEEAKKTHEGNSVLSKSITVDYEKLREGVAEYVKSVNKREEDREIRFDKKLFDWSKSVADLDLREKERAKEFQDHIEKWSTAVSNLEARALESIKLRAPIEYWQKQVSTQAKRKSEAQRLFRREAFITAACASALILLLAFAFKDFLQNKELIIPLAPALGVLGLAAVWLLRHRAREFMDASADLRDAEQRVTQLQTYVAMAEARDEKEERLVALTALFRPGPSQTGDDGIPLPLIELLKK